MSSLAASPANGERVEMLKRASPILQVLLQFLFIYFLFSYLFFNLLLFITGIYYRREARSQQLP